MAERHPGANSEPQKIVIVRRAPGEEHEAHHGGAWKIAYADFVTAMMAFFLLMWLLGSTSQSERNGIEKYFNTPLSTLLGGKADEANPRSSVVQGGGEDLSTTHPGTSSTNAKQLAPDNEAADLQRLQQLKAKLSQLIEQTPALKAFKDQIRIDITSEGLRIEIVDSLKRPMFTSGSSALEDYAYAILLQIGSTLNDVDNRVTIAGHTDSVPYSGDKAGYSNWELSSERANAARRALVAGGMKEDKLLQVRGLADVLPLDKNMADEPRNRRISIVVLNKAAERAFFNDGGRAEVDGSQLAGKLPFAASDSHGLAGLTTAQAAGSGPAPATSPPGVPGPK